MIIRDSWAARYYDYLIQCVNKGLNWPTIYLVVLIWIVPLSQSFDENIRETFALHTLFQAVNSTIDNADSWGAFVKVSTAPSRVEFHVIVLFLHWWSIHRLA